MNARVTLIMLAALAAGCNGGPGGGPTPAPKWNPALTEPMEQTSSNSDQEKKVLEERIKLMEERLKFQESQKPLPSELTQAPPSQAPVAQSPVSPGTVSAAPVEASRQVAVSDVIASLETKGTLTPREQFELDVLHALTKSKDRRALVPMLWPNVEKGYSPAWFVMLNAMDTCAEGKPDETLARLSEAEE
jgi:hypothetical protein